MAICAYIPNQSTNTVSVIDTSTNLVVGTISVGNEPTYVAITPDGTKAYVSNQGAGTISVINTSNNTVLTVIPVGSSPLGIAITPNGHYAYVANSGSGTVSVINTSTNAVSTTITVGSGPIGIGITPDGAYAYVANDNDGTVSVIDTSTNTVKTGAGYPISVGTSPDFVAITPDGTKAYVTNYASGTVSVINTSTNTVSTTITVGTNPGAIAITPDGNHAYVPLNVSTGNTVKVINTSSNTVSATINIGSSATGPTGVSITPDGNYAYVANALAQNVAVIATSTNTVSTTISLPASSFPQYGNFIQSSSTLVTTTNGGFMNKFRNGTMDIWQRGIGSISVSTSGAYVADGWIVVPTGASCTAQQTTSNTRTGALSTYSLLMTGASSVTDILVKQRIESFIAQQLEGQQVTVQAQVYNNTGASITPTLTVKHANAADNWSASTTDVSAVSLQVCANGAWTQVAYTFAASSSSGNGLEITFDFGNNFSTTGKSVQITELDIRPTPGVATGLNSSPPVPEMRPIQVELALCQRYLEMSYDIGTAPGTVTTNGAAYQRANNTSVDINIEYRVSKRAIPTVTAYSPNSGASGKIYGTDNLADYTANLAYSGINAFIIYNDTLTASHGYSVNWTASAEL